VKSLGADFVIDDTTTDSLAPSARFDFILDAVGRVKSSKLKAACKAALTPTGRYVSIDDGALELVSARLELVKDLLEAGHLRPVVDRCYPFEKMAEAHQYVQRGHKAGGVAITV